MSGLEITFYIVGITFMGLSLILLTALFISVLVIRNKVQAIQENIREKIEMANRIINIARPSIRIFKQILKVRRMLR